MTSFAHTSSAVSSRALAGISPGDIVELMVQPDGKLSSQYALHVGGLYQVLDLMGCCLVVTTDEAGDSASVNVERFRLVARSNELKHFDQLRQRFQEATC